MPPTKKAASATKKVAPAPHASYRDMIKDAIVNLKERNGSSRQAIKKYVVANNKIAIASQGAFDAQFNKAIKSGVDKGEFTQPKGPSGPVKVAKKEVDAKPAAKPAAKTAAKPAAKTAAKTAAKPVGRPAGKPAAKKTATKATAKKVVTEKTPAKRGGKPGPKPAVKKTATANSGKTRKTTKTSTAAPAIVEQPKIISKTKSGRVTKTTAPPPAKTATKKRAAKK